MFEIFINDGSTKIPDNDIMYIIAKEGIFLKKKVGILESIAPVKNISILKSVGSSAKLNIPKIPDVKFAKVVELFKAVDEKHSSECTAMVHYNDTKKRYRIEIPPQEVSAFGVDYESNVSYPNYDTIGTIHSHSTMSAFHSPTDLDDEKDRDGLHITVGKVDNEFPEISAEIAANGSRFKVNPEDYIEGIELVTWESDKPSVLNVLNQSKTENSKVLKMGYKINVEPRKRMFDRKWLDQINKKIFKVDVSSIDITKKFVYNDSSFKTIIEAAKLAEGDDYNPCEGCPFKEYKLDMQMEDLLEDIEWDEEIEEINEPDFLEGNEN